MNTIFKRFEALATNSKATNFKGAVIRLTAYYTIGVFLILAVFNILVYGLFSAGIEREIHEDTFIVERHILIEGDTESEGVTDDLLNVLLVSDTTILILTLIVSYLLARKTLAPLGDAYQKQKRFVADAAHELRTPLAVIKAGSELFLQNERTGSEYKQFIAESQEEIERLIALSNDLLFLTQNVEAQVYTFEKFSVSDICTKQFENISAYAKTKHITMQSHIEKELCMFGKRDDISRLVLNLLKNAIDYNKLDGSVALTLAKKQSDIVLTVSDTGIGIAQSDIPHIFERFYKADSSRTQTNTSGSGLGLALVHEITTLHKGIIQVTSTLNSGTTFELSFPCV